MNAVHNTLNWLKANPIPVICIIITIASAVTFYIPTYTSSLAFRAELEDRNSQVQMISQLQTTHGLIPASEPDAPPIDVTMAVNQKAIDSLNKVFADLDSQYTGIFDSAADYNQNGYDNENTHDVMLKGIFPKPANDGLSFIAREAYTQAFNELYATLKSTIAPTDVQKNEILTRVENNYLKARNLSSPGTADKLNITTRQTADLLIEYNNIADQYSVYAPETKLDEQSGDWQPGVFQVMEWAKLGPKPLEFDMWEGQMQLWIQQDIVKAIRIANQIDDITADSSLLKQPIKRIMGIYVAEGYVGLDTLNNPVPAAGATAASTSSGTAFSIESRSGAEVATPETVQGALDSRIVDNFLTSGTGRQSNPIYDVRQAYLSIIVDSQQIPKVLNALGQVNYMTVIGIKTTDVDEYAHLREGYFYGQIDAIQLDIHIETVWLRSWTAGDLVVDEENKAAFNPGLMPDDVRYHLNLPPRSENYLAERTNRIDSLKTTQ